MRGEAHVQEPVRLQAGPRPEAGADADVHLLAREVDQPVPDLEPDRDARVRRPERAQPRHEPVRGEDVERAHGQRAVRVAANGLERRPDRAQGLAHHGRQPRAGLGQGHPPGRAQEERRPEALLEQPHLVAHGRLGHAELGRGAGEVSVPGRRLEHPHGRQRRQGSARHG